MRCIESIRLHYFCYCATYVAPLGPVLKPPLLCTLHLPAVLLFAQVLETLVRIKRKDPVIFQKDVVLFPEETAADADGEAAAAAGEHKKEKGSSKPVYLRTVLAKQVGVGTAAGVM